MSLFNYLKQGPSSDTGIIRGTASLGSGVAGGGGTIDFNLPGATYENGIVVVSGATEGTYGVTNEQGNISLILRRSAGQVAGTSTATMFWPAYADIQTAFGGSGGSPSVQLIPFTFVVAAGILSGVINDLSVQLANNAAAALQINQTNLFSMEVAA